MSGGIAAEARAAVAAYVEERTRCALPVTQDYD
jgi:hypothetical protein